MVGVVADVHRQAPRGGMGAPHSGQGTSVQHFAVQVTGARVQSLSYRVTAACASATVTISSARKTAALNSAGVPWRVRISSRLAHGGVNEQAEQVR
jgi:hypothetical protein